MQSGRSRQHAISKHIHRSKISQVLADTGEAPELRWYDDDYPLDDYPLQEEEHDYDEWKCSQEELAAQEAYLDEEDDFEHYRQLDAYYEQLDEQLDPEPPNLTRSGGEWQF